MKRELWSRPSIGLAAVLVLVVGCARSEDRSGPPKNPDKGAAAAESKHEGWWCDEHGIPEAECSMCMSAEKAKKLFKDKGDWCKEHNRAKSQCFICDPSLMKSYADQYRDKYGKEPPPPVKNMPRDKME